jgi:hypothetical protein
MGEELNCVNYELCEHTTWSLTGECCMTCGSWFKVGGFGWDKLTFIDCVDEECGVCLNSCNRKLLFPTNCGHSFCIRCSRELLFFDESKYHLDPCNYGCPPCPNGCTEECCCDEFEELYENLEKNNPEKFEEFNNNQIISIEQGENNYIIHGKKCPMCRSKYSRNPESNIPTDPYPLIMN